MDEGGKTPARDLGRSVKVRFVKEKMKNFSLLDAHEFK